MTFKTCKDQLERAEKLRDEKLVEFWKQRIDLKYPSEKIEKPKKK